MDIGALQERYGRLQAGVETLQLEVLQAEQRLEQMQRALALQQGAVSECRFWLTQALPNPATTVPEPEAVQ